MKIKCDVTCQFFVTGSQGCWCAQREPLVRLNDHHSGIGYEATIECNKMRMRARSVNRLPTLTINRGDYDSVLMPHLMSAYLRLEKGDVHDRNEARRLADAMDRVGEQIRESDDALIEEERVREAAECAVS